MKKETLKKQIKSLERSLNDSNDFVKSLRVELNISKIHNERHVYEITCLKGRLKVISILLDKINL